MSDDSKQNHSLPENLNSTRFWQVSPGPWTENHWEEFRKSGIIAIGWDEQKLGDLKKYGTKDDIKNALRKHSFYADKPNPINDINSLWFFSKEIQKGDVIVAKKGLSREIYGVGKVTGDYYFDDKRSTYKHVMRVNWIISFEERVTIDMSGSFVQWTVNYLDPQVYSRVKSFILNMGPVYESKFAILEAPINFKTSTDVSSLTEISSVLENKRQIVLYGPPGTGKTYFAKQLAIWLLTGKALNEPDQISSLFRELQTQCLAELVQFHPAYSYEDFVEGIRPFTQNEKVYYRIQEGIFKSFCIQPAQLSEKKEVLFAKVAKYVPLDQPARFVLETLQQFGINKIERNDFSNIVEHALLNNPLQVDFQDLDKYSGFYVLRLKEDSPYADIEEQEYHYQIGIPGSKQMTNDLSAGNVAFAYYDSKKGGVFGIGYFSGSEKTTKTEETIEENHRRVLIIDEINRGNIAKIFGELIYALEYRGERVRLQYSGADSSLPDDERYLAIPRNLLIIGTMNTADRSIALVDMALRRRFSFIERMPDLDFLASFLLSEEKLDIARLKEKVKNGIDRNEQIKALSILAIHTLNEKIANNSKLGREKQIGQSYLMKLQKDTEVNFVLSWKYEILPLLEEYFYYNYSELEAFFGSNIINKQGGIKSFTGKELFDSLTKLCSL